MVDRLDPGEAAASLRVILGAVDRGEVEATAPQAAYLAGAAEALEAVAGQSGGGVEPTCER